jgi:phosphatidylserine/phosphatidylglycerophosphate/cardiolipin synthase-like enzyme
VLRDNLSFRRRIEHFYRYAIAQAKSEIIIANAYFVPGVALQRALLKAAGRGVQGDRCCCRAATSTSCSTTPAGRCTA